MAKLYSILRMYYITAASIAGESNFLFYSFAFIHINNLIRFENAKSVFGQIQLLKNIRKLKKNVSVLLFKIVH
jgi:hypothetical protein